jgi:hypothetical protein
VIIVLARFHSNQEAALLIGYKDSKLGYHSGTLEKSLLVLFTI